jgi:hypothetical protein
MTRVTVAILTVMISGQATTGLKPERFTAIMTAGPVTSSPVPIDIVVNRWRTAADRDRLAAAFQSGGQPALLAALRKDGAAGYILMRNHERLVAAYAEQEARPDGGRRVLLLCERQGGDWEFMRDAGWSDHLFRMLALTLDSRDRGTGMLFHVSQVSFSSKGPDLVHELSGQPTMLLSVQRTR